MVEVCVLASGSSGNCFVFQGGDDTFLIDCGISCKRIKERLSSCGKDISDIKGIFITHEHIDHVSALKTLTNRYDIPIYLTKGTLKGLKAGIPSDSVHLIRPDEKITINETAIMPFTKSHDANEPVSFACSHGGKTASFITDIGYACSNTRRFVSKSDILVIESNHDLGMLNSGRYPLMLKQRITGMRGHLSNYDAALLILEHAKTDLQHVFLSHLSQNNNTPQLAHETLRIMIQERRDLRCSCEITGIEYPSNPYRA